MSFRISPPPPMSAALKDDNRLPLNSNPTGLIIEEEWVEIIEPKSKSKIYANLDSGVCAKSPPEGVSVLKADDFDDHWWELYDKKTGKYYYYNPEQQKTVWTKPASNGATATNGSARRKLLIVPVSKLQTFRKLSPVSEQRNHQQISKSDASTQTVASNLVNAGTQTYSETDICEKLNDVDLKCAKPQEESKASIFQSSNRISSRIAEYQNVFKCQQSPPMNNRYASDLSSKNRKVSLKMATNDSVKHVRLPSDSSNISQSLDQTDHADHHDNNNRPSHIGSVSKKLYASFINASNKHDKNKDQVEVQNDFGLSPSPPPPVSYQKLGIQQHKRRSIHLPEKTSSSSFRPDDHTHTSTTIPTSTFRQTTSPQVSLVPASTGQPVVQTPELNQQQRQQHSPPHLENAAKQHQPTQQVVTNNLSHYLVREARAMGIALISDDELDDDDQDSDDDCLNDDDEDTDLRDDLSSNKDAENDLHNSQDLGDDSSEGGWRSGFSDQESPNKQQANRQPMDQQHSSSGGGGRRKYKLKRPAPEKPMVPNSPISCEASSFRYDNTELIDDQKDPTTCMSQQLDHRKLVENFKKTRQTSALGFNDSLSRSYRLDANNAVQRLKTVADTYFNSATNQSASSPGHSVGQDRDSVKMNERYLHHLSTLSTLPRPLKTKPPQVPSADNGLDVDADYDVVEENCSYYSDSERSRLASFDQSSRSQLDTSKASKVGAVASVDTPAKSYFDRNKSTRGSTFSVESFARENLTRHPKKGGLLFNRRVKWSRMISWTKSSIKQPMISSVSSDLTADSIASFKLIQQFMGDRKITISKRYRQLLLQAGLTEQEISSMTNRKSLGRAGSLSANSTLNTSSSNVGTTPTSSGSTSSTSLKHIPDRLRDELAYELTSKGCVKSALRDEIFVQLARQLTDNPSSDSVNWGFALMSILLNYFSPSSKFAPFLFSFLETHTHLMARDVCLPRLDKRLRHNWISYCRKPADGKEISIVRLSITKWPQYCGVFGESLERIMALQACSPYLKTLRLPWILTTLADKLFETGGQETEGIFRCAADHDLLAQLRLEIDCVDFRKITDVKQLKSLLSNVDDPHVIAGLLKLFFRQLSEPVFPTRMYDSCLLSCQDAAMACRLFNDHLPNLNKDVVAYLIRLLQALSEQDKVMNTKMDSSNLSMVWAPNLLRAPERSNDLLLVSGSAGETSRSGSKWSISNGSSNTGDEQQHNSLAAQPAQSQSMVFEQTRQEMQFIKLLISNLDTSFIKDVL